MRAVRSRVVALWLAAVAVVAAVDDPADPAAAQSGSAPALYNAWIRFYAGFDRGAAADLAAGEPKATRSRGEVLLERGRVERALLLGLRGGGGEIAYATAGNLDLAHPGALSFWIRAVAWQGKAAAGESGYVRFLRIPGVGRSVFVVERDVRQPGSDQEKFIIGFFDLSGGEKHYLSLRAGPRWTPEAWHLIVVAWDAVGFAVSVDGGPFTRKAVPSGRIRADFGDLPAGATWLVGDETRESTLLDELTIYARQLSDEEARRLYDAGLDANATSAPSP